MSAKTARIAVVGAGWWSQGWHLPHLGRNAKCELAAIVDPTAHPKSNLNPEMESLTQLSERYDCSTFSSLEEMLEPGSGAGEIDGVVVFRRYKCTRSVYVQTKCYKLLGCSDTFRQCRSRLALHVLSNELRGE